ncbi:MAG: prephenate dehydratase [Hyphomicrobiaceae bacterium]
MPDAKSRSAAGAAAKRARSATDKSKDRDAARATASIAYQGELGAFSHLAAGEMFPSLSPMPCATFEDALAAVKSGEAKYGMIPIENSLAGRVADIHHLLPESGLYIVGEHFLPIRFQLMGLKGAKLSDITDVYSHVHALGQCRKIIRDHGLKRHVAGDTAGSARQVAEWGDKTKAALAPRLAAKIYGLDILAEDVEDEKHNATRFVVLAREPDDADPGVGPVMTTFIFNVRNVPAALYKAMGGFATNGVNMTKLESYQVRGEFVATMFFADIEGHAADRNVRLAMEELSFFSTEIRILGTYPASPYRAEIARKVAARALGTDKR